MENTYIRVKFTPLIRNFPRPNSNYFLEIVPTVSCVKNINKIVLRDEKDSIEYLIPMTYKIVIKKQKNDDSLKIFHSCVDLLPSSSLFNFNSGNVVRHNISETYILSKADNSLEDVIVPKFNFQMESEENSNTKCLNDKKHINCKKITCDKSTSYNKDKKIINISPNLQKPIKKNLHMTMTPLYNININDVISYKHNSIKTNSCLSSYVLHYQQPKKSDIWDLHTYKYLYNRNYECNVLLKKILNTNVRVLPEERVANFKRIMEQNILPLKIALNDIINKCTILGVYDLLSNLQINKNLNEFSTHSGIEKKCKCNRVVYSIIFDE